MNLDEVNSFPTLDSKNILDILSNFPEHIIQSKAIVSHASIPRLYDIDHILICASGNEAIAAEVFQLFLREKSTIPISVNQTGNLPKWVNKHTLVYCVSVNGEDLEPMSSFKEAIQKHCKIIGMTSNGHLKEFCLHRNFPLIDLPKEVPARLTVAYLFFCLLYSVLQTGLLQLNFDSDINDCLDTLGDMKKSLLPSIPHSQNLAKQLALQIEESIPLIFGWDKFNPVARLWMMHFHQNAKRVTYQYQVPECTYFSLVGWAHHHSVQKYSSILIRDDQLESKEMKKRLDFLELFYQDLTDKQISISPHGKSILAKMFSLIYLGLFTSVYTALLHNIDPGPTPILHQLDEELAIV